jgi:DNA anti-recombination protein RmuC
LIGIAPLAFSVLQTTTSNPNNYRISEEVRENIAVILNELDKFHSKFDKMMKYLENIEKTIHNNVA